MSEKKKSSVDFIFNAFNLLSDSDFKAWMLNNHDAIKAMHKEEIEAAYFNGQKNGNSYGYNGVVFVNKAKYYKQTFGIKKNEKRS